ncbi:MAG: NUDIX domain-containing protein [Pseudomonadota bacterium]
MGVHYSLRERLQQKVFHLVFRATRSMTLGVRALVVRDGVHGAEVWLVRHTYVRGWYLPGGGVERGETVRQALEKELREEGNLRLTGEPELRGCLFNTTTTSRDHVCYFVVRECEQTAPYGSNREIAEGRWFALNQLPENLTRATRARIEEFVEGTPTPDAW